MTDIFVVGLGIETATQITREVEDVIRRSREVLYLDTGVATRALLEGLCPRVTSLYEQSYVEGCPRTDAYVHIAAVVLDAALDHAPVTFAIHGHPLVAVQAPFLVLEAAAALGLGVRILPGISALDAILAILRLDPVVHGLQMYEATDLLLRRRPLQPDVPALLWQIGPLETALHSTRASRPERFARLVAHLRRFYPPHHRVTAIYAPPHPLLEPEVLTFQVEEMGDYALRLHAGFTLYVPPARGRLLLDLDLAAEMFDPQHLRTISRE